MCIRDRAAPLVQNKNIRLIEIPALYKPFLVKRSFGEEAFVRSPPLRRRPPLIRGAQSGQDLLLFSCLEIAQYRLHRFSALRSFSRPAPGRMSGARPLYHVRFREIPLALIFLKG